MARTGHLCDKVLLTAYTSPTVLLAAAALVLCFAELNIGPGFGQFHRKARRPWPSACT